MVAILACLTESTEAQHGERDGRLITYTGIQLMLISDVTAKCTRMYKFGKSYSNRPMIFVESSLGHVFKSLDDVLKLLNAPPGSSMQNVHGTFEQRIKLKDNKRLLDFVYKLGATCLENVDSREMTEDLDSGLMTTNLNITRGRVIPWKGWNDVNGPSIEKKSFIVKLTVVAIILCSLHVVTLRLFSQDGEWAGSTNGSY